MRLNRIKSINDSNLIYYQIIELVFLLVGINFIIPLKYKDTLLPQNDALAIYPNAKYLSLLVPFSSP